MDIAYTKENENERLQDFAKFVVMCIQGIKEEDSLYEDEAYDIINEAMVYGLVEINDDGLFESNVETNDV